MNRIDGIIADVEQDYGIELHVNDIPTDILCNNDCCRFSDCDCYDWFKDKLVEIAKEYPNATT